MCVESFRQGTGNADGIVMSGKSQGWHEAMREANKSLTQQPKLQTTTDPIHLLCHWFPRPSRLGSPSRDDVVNFAVKEQLKKLRSPTDDFSYALNWWRPVLSCGHTSNPFRIRALSSCVLGPNFAPEGGSK